MSAGKSNAGPVISSSKEADGTNASARKPYQPPTLKIYGSIQKLTNNLTTGSKNDGGGGSMNMMV